MKRALRLLALLVTVVAPIAWWAMGANRGWTRTSVPVKIVDAVTGIEGIEYHQQFVPGVDLLAASLAAAGTLAGLSLFFRTPTTNQNETLNP
jgi:hypothetical protein